MVMGLSMSDAARSALMWWSTGRRAVRVAAAAVGAWARHVVGEACGLRGSPSEAARDKAWAMQHVLGRRQKDHRLGRMWFA